MLQETTSLLIVTIVSILIIFCINFFFKDSILKQVLNFIFISEAFVLTFFFGKYPLIFSVPLLVTSLLLFSRSSLNFDSGVNDESKVLVSDKEKYHKFFGILLLLLIVIYEFFSDFNFSSTSFLVFAFSLHFLFYDKIPSKLNKEFNFSFFMFFFLFIFFVTPMILHKFKYDAIGTTSTETILLPRNFLVENFLAMPLGFTLKIMGYNNFVNGQYLHINDLSSGGILIVGIADSCSGVYSILIFCCAMLSYLQSNNLNISALSKFNIILLGIIISYIANLLRMAIIILSGHYYGGDMLTFVHQNIGWLIFSFWMFLFFSFINRFILGPFNENHSN